MADLKREKSYGVIPLKKGKGEWEVLLIQHRAGSYWAFPKGREQPGESQLETAKRELFEETGLRLKVVLSDVWLTEQYQFDRTGTLVEKSVAYCIGEVEGDVHLQEEEVLGYTWLPLSEVAAHLTFLEARRVWFEAIEILS